MSAHDPANLVATLGPTNTGKTHLAVERLCAHSSGMIGFPLRLLAREVYDRVVAIKGTNRVALITGEEKIVPADARWFLCTAESMPLDRDFAFVALDEAQLGADPERGHVFTDRLLHARGREETMILGSEALRPMIRSLLPKADIVTRPRFSTLSYAGSSKLSRLPPRSAVVAFSAEQVYAVAEMLRRMRGGAAVVMGALSPRTRNAQVAMYQAGEVDYLVATDAIGMGLNMDVTHVAFAGLGKFDGRRRRRLTSAEMAQIAGRAGRHQRDGAFGALAVEGGHGAEFRPEEIEAIEEHRFPALDHLNWRDGDPDVRSLEALIRDLERRPDEPGLRAAPEAVDLAVLKRLAEDPDVRRRASGERQVRRLWAACGLPDFRKTGADHHARLVGRIFAHLSEGAGFIPHAWMAQEVAKLDNVQGDIETLADRIAGVRTWAYLAHRADWLADPADMAARTRGVEETLSDALHDRLTQRFVDRRTAVLMRDVGGKNAAEFPVIVDEQGEVSVGTYPIGRLDGFDFTVDPAARHTDRKMLLATAERRLGGEYAKRAAALSIDEDPAFALVTAAGAPPGISWRGHNVARLRPGKNLLSPGILLDRRLDRIAPAGRAAIEARLAAWMAARLQQHLSALRAIGAAGQDRATPPALRAVLAMVADEGGAVDRHEVEAALRAVAPPDRRSIRSLKVTIGALDLFAPPLLKPEPARWIAALKAVRSGAPMPSLPAPGQSVVAAPAFGFRDLGGQQLRVDLVERIARQAHRARAGEAERPVDDALITSLDLQPAALTRLMKSLGFRAAADGGDWEWRGRSRPRPGPSRSVGGNAFSMLAGLKRG